MIRVFESLKVQSGHLHITNRGFTGHEMLVTYAGQVGIYTEYDNLYYMRARYYDANLRQFISEDPAGFIDGPNLYAYVGGNPIYYVDPTGLSAEAWLYGRASGQFGGYKKQDIDLFITDHSTGAGNFASGLGLGVAAFIPPNVKAALFRSYLEYRTSTLPEQITPLPDSVLAPTPIVIQIPR